MTEPVADPVADPTSRRSKLARLGHQIGWSFAARLASSLLQLVVIVLLARGLPPHEFAWVASVNVVMLALVATNGFGLQRQITLRLARDPSDPVVASLFNLRQKFTAGSAAAWAVGCVALAVLTGDGEYLAVLPIAVWLVFEQTTSLWNGISLVEGRSQDLMPSYLLRRAPVVGALLLAGALDWDVVWTWSVGLAVGSVLAFARGFADQRPWARRLVPHRRDDDEPLDLDFAYWWAMVGVEVRDLDVAALTAISGSAGGAYALPARLVKPMNMITIATISVIMPMAARRRVVTRRELLLGSALGSVPVALVAGALAAVAHLLPDLVGEEYRAAVPALRVLCLAAVITGFGSLVVTVMQTRGEAVNRFAGYAILAFGLVQIVAAAAAGAAGGATAAAWAAVGTQGVLVASLTLRTLRECGGPLAGTTTSTADKPGATSSP